jgi:hypothetical protein
VAPLAALELARAALPLNPIARWEWVFPLVESVHICGATLLIGTAAILDLRLLGVSLRAQPLSRLARELSPWFTSGLLLQLTTGPYLFSGDPGDYLQVEAFRHKMLLLGIALIFQFSVMRSATAPERDSAPLAWRRAAAVVSLVLWLSVALAGLWIGNL